MAIRKARHSTSWPLAEAKAHLDEVIDEVEDGESQSVLTNGDERAAIVPVEEWRERDRPEGTLAEFFHRSGLGDAELDITRHPDKVADLRDIDL